MSKIKPSASVEDPLEGALTATVPSAAIENSLKSAMTEMMLRSLPRGATGRLVPTSVREEHGRELPGERRHSEVLGHVQPERIESEHVEERVSQGPAEWCRSGYAEDRVEEGIKQQHANEHLEEERAECAE